MVRKRTPRLDILGGHLGEVLLYVEHNEESPVVHFEDFNTKGYLNLKTKGSPSQGYPQH